jgi:hypothetical protein
MGEKGARRADARGEKGRDAIAGCDKRAHLERCPKMIS